MPFKKGSFVAALAAIPVLLLSGCATLTSPARIHPLTPNAPYIADMDASRRIAILLPRPDGKGVMYCAEPSPDVAYNSVISLVASIQLQNPSVDASTQLQFQQSVVELAQRTETIQFLREALYRLCEQSLNGTMSQASVQQEYDNALKTALALAEADLVKAQSGLPAQMADPKVQELWKKLLSQPTATTITPAK
ncbi:MAG TPA: hypothetical protein V6C69_21690 [Trichormus sp.]